MEGLLVFLLKLLGALILFFIGYEIYKTIELMKESKKRYENGYKYGRRKRQ